MDDHTRQVRRCQACGEDTLLCVSQTTYTRRGDAVGADASFKCTSCGAFVSFAGPNLLFLFAGVGGLPGVAGLFAIFLTLTSRPSLAWSLRDNWGWLLLALFLCSLSIPGVWLLVKDLRTKRRNPVVRMLPR